MTDTTTEHADLIDRLEAEHSRLIEVAAGIEKYDESHDMEEAMRASSIAKTAMLLKDAATALRTSYRDGWLGAADECDSAAVLAGLGTDADGYVLAADHLRRSAPQEEE